MEDVKTTDYKEIIIQNMVALRKAYSYTQGELAAIVNYSDKAISKWERGESTPDVIALKKMAELYNVSMDYFFEEHKNEKIDTSKDKKEITKKSIFITAITSAGILVLITIFFVVGLILNLDANKLWLAFVAYLPIEAIVLLVFNMLWGNKKYNIYLSSGILWSVLAFVYLLLLNYNLWYVFLLGIPVQIVLLLIHKFLRTK